MRWTFFALLITAGVTSTGVRLVSTDCSRSQSWALDAEKPSSRSVSVHRASATASMNGCDDRAGNGKISSR